MNGIPAPFVRANQWFQVLSVLIALVSGVYWILAVPLAFGAYSLAFRRNPLFYLIPPFLKKPLSEYQQEDADQQRFNQWIAVICLGLSLLGFLAGLPAVGYAFAVLVGLAAAVALLGFCIGCFIRFQYLQWRHRRTK
jgi:hypothetical protein